MPNNPTKVYGNSLSLCQNQQLRYQVHLEVGHFWLLQEAVSDRNSVPVVLGEASEGKYPTCFQYVEGVH